MIDFLRGKPVYVDGDAVVWDVNGVGYRVFCPNPYAFAGKADQELTLYTHQHVREDAITLYGFASREEQALFRKLLDVTGIGPRVALGILSGAPPERIVTAIQSEDLAFLTRLPGIGKKTAQRMLLDLKDKLDGIGVSIPASLASAEGEAASGAAGDEPGGVVTAWREAKEALMSLGYTEAETDKVWRVMQDQVQPGAGADQLVKLALQSFHKI